MNPTDDLHQKGDTICRPTDWTDIAKFFLLNYGLHALTVVPAPGSTRLHSTILALVSILMPSYGVSSALGVLSRTTIREETELETALRAGALCMVIPSKYIMPQYLNPIVHQLGSIHGQYPVKNHELANKQQIDEEQGSLQAHSQTGETLGHSQRKSPEDNPPLHDYCLVTVPPSFAVMPLVVPQPNPASRPKQAFIHRVKTFIDIPRKIRDAFGTQPGGVTTPSLACNYSSVKIFAAILQILYGSFELYKARGDQVERFGYASYSLTVIPYVLMSLVNLLASLTAPQYPTKFLVYYRGVGEEPEDRVVPQSIPNLSSDGSGPSLPTEPTVEEGENDPNCWWEEGEWEKVEKMISGAVGKVYGDCTARPSLPESREEEISTTGAGILFLGILAAPFIVIKLLTNFGEGHSTRSQRSWIMCWIVIGQAGVLLQGFVIMLSPVRRIIGYNSLKTYFILAAIRIVLSVSTIGGFIVVAQMMLADKVCMTI